MSTVGLFGLFRTQSCRHECVQKQLHSRMGGRQSYMLWRQRDADRTIGFTQVQSPFFSNVRRVTDCMVPKDDPRGLRMKQLIQNHDQAGLYSDPDPEAAMGRWSWQVRTEQSVLMDHFKRMRYCVQYTYPRHS